MLFFRHFSKKGYNDRNHGINTGHDPAYDRSAYSKEKNSQQCIFSFTRIVLGCSGGNHKRCTIRAGCSRFDFNPYRIYFCEGRVTQPSIADHIEHINDNGVCSRHQAPFKPYRKNKLCIPFVVVGVRFKPGIKYIHRFRFNYRGNSTHCTASNTYLCRQGPFAGLINGINMPLFVHGSTDGDLHHFPGAGGRVNRSRNSDRILCRLRP